jgi:hypothetical protein
LAMMTEERPPDRFPYAKNNPANSFSGEKETT